MTTPRADRIARSVISQLDKLPPKRKPAMRDNGLGEWVPLSGIVADRDSALTCLALATGIKCLPAAKLPAAAGNALHDWNAEVLAIRAFNRLLLDECTRLSAGAAAAAGAVVEWARGDGPRARPFRIGRGVKLHMYCSEAPCGDASMELTMAAQDDASPWDASGSDDGPLPGRAYFSRLGIVRRKPARGDAPATASKSCSDKLALKQCTSLLSSLTSLFVNPANAYIDTLVLPAPHFSAVACDRAFSATGRVAPVAGAVWPGGYTFRPFAVETTTEEFAFSRKAVQARAGKISPCNVAAAWSCSGLDESLVGGVIQGRRLFDPRGASRVSRRRIWAAAAQLAGRLHSPDEHPPDEHRLFSGAQTYQDVKDGPLLAERRAVKAAVRQTALAGWVANEGDSAFRLDTAP